MRENFEQAAIRAAKIFDRAVDLLERYVAHQEKVFLLREKYGIDVFADENENEDEDEE